MAKAPKQSTTQSAFSSMKNNRESGLKQLNTELEKMASTGPVADPTYWVPTVDKTGNGYAIIRFLPAAQGEDVPFVRLFNHAFKVGTQWYIENSLTTIGQQDPASEANRELWATGTKENQDIVRNRKRKLNFISNIYVVKDAANPEAEGKVFKYKYGKKIWDKISDAMTGIPEEDVKGFNPFDMWEGANFKLRIRTVENFRNYDKSEFDDQGPLMEDDSDMEKVWLQCALLQPEIGPDKFKTYEQLETQLNKVIGRSAAPRGPKTDAPAPRGTPARGEDSGFGDDATSGTDDDDLKRFRELAAED